MAVRSLAFALLLALAAAADGAAPALRTGELLTAARPVPQMTLQGPEGPWPAGAWLRHWTLVVAADGACAGPCAWKLAAGSAALAAMGEDRPEGFRVVVVAGGATTPGTTAAGVTLLGGEAAGQWLREAGVTPGGALLVDPLLRIRARFPEPATAADLAADLLAIHERYAPEFCISDRPGRVELLGPGR